MHGTGNDFVVLDGIRHPVRMNAALARKICDRHFGVGADQILIIEKSKKADFKMRILNADGSEVEMCGNGIRCAARYVKEKGLTRKTDLVFDTLAGRIQPRLQSKEVRVDMGQPVLKAEKIPTKGTRRVIDTLLTWNSHQALVTCVSMGNPHAVVFVNDLGAVPVTAWGPKIETHAFFPKRANVEFVQVTGPCSAFVRVWERGAGLTMACGTGACAVCVAGVLTGRLQRKVTLSLPGGNLKAEWAGNNHVYLTGPAAFVYEGEI